MAGRLIGTGALRRIRSDGSGFFMSCRTISSRTSRSCVVIPYHDATSSSVGNLGSRRLFSILLHEVFEISSYAFVVLLGCRCLLALRSNSNAGLDRSQAPNLRGTSKISKSHLAVSIPFATGSIQMIPTPDLPSTAHKSRLFLAERGSHYRSFQCSILLPRLSHSFSRTLPPFPP